MEEGESSTEPESMLIRCADKRARLASTSGSLPTGRCPPERRAIADTTEGFLWRCTRQRSLFQICILKVMDQLGSSSDDASRLMRTCAGLVPQPWFFICWILFRISTKVNLVGARAFTSDDRRVMLLTGPIEDLIVWWKRDPTTEGGAAANRGCGA